MSGLRDIQRRKALRAGAAAADNPKKDERGIKRTDSELDMLAEKAALLGKNDDDVDVFVPLSTGTTGLASPTANPLGSPLGAENGENGDPLASRPAVQSPEPGPASKPMSEKARGKMRATSISSIPSVQGVNVDTDVADEELMRIALAGVGPNGYVPTQEWVSSWQKG